MMDQQTLQKTEEESVQELSAIFSQNLALTEENQTLKEKVAEMESWIRENRTDLMADMILLEEKKTEILSLQKTTEERAASIEDYNVKIAVREKKVSIREKESDQKEKRLEKREARISDREYQYGAVEAELAALDKRGREINEETEKLNAAREQLRRTQQDMEYERKKLERDKAKLGDTQGYIYTVEGQLRDRYRRMTKTYKIVIGLLAAYAGVISFFVYLA